MLRPIANFVSDFFNSPKKVLALCVASAFLVLVVDGTLLQLWEMHRNKTEMSSRIEDYKSGIKDLQKKLDLANRPEFVEKKARDRFDLVNEGEIVFVFSDN